VKTPAPRRPPPPPRPNALKTAAPTPLKEPPPQKWSEKIEERLDVDAGRELFEENPGRSRAEIMRLRAQMQRGARRRFTVQMSDPAFAADAAQAASQPLDATLTAFAALTIAANTLTIGTGADAFSQLTLAANAFPGRSSAGNVVAKTMTDFGFSLVDDADAAAAQTTLGLVIGTNVQAYDATLTALAGAPTAADKLPYFTGTDTVGTTTFTAFARTILDDADAAAVQTTLGLVIGTNVQAYDATLTGLAGLPTAADKGIYATGTDTFGSYDLTSFGRTLGGSADAAAARVTLLAAGYVALRNVHTNTTPAASTATLLEETLMSYTLPGATLATNKDRVEIEAFGTAAANGTTKRLRLYFGATVLFDGGVVALNGTSWHIRATVFRTGAATQTAFAVFAGDTVLVPPTALVAAPTETLSGDVIIKLTSMLGVGAAANDVVQNGLLAGVGVSA
jgi:hypothetical protein